jgi:tetratricopeptide (TPR) repeat protein
MFDDEEDDEIFEGNFNEYLERFERSLKGEPLGYIDGDHLESIIDHYLINGNYSKASLCADIGIEQFPFNALFFLRKAQAISAIGQLKEAMELLSTVEKMEIPSCEFFLTKAAIFSQLKDSKRAVKFFAAALAISEIEDKDEIYLDLAMEYENGGDFSSAINTLKEAIKFNPQNEGAIYELAYCYDQTNEIEKAISCYSDFIDENPYSFTAWYNLGNAYSKLENFEKAIWAYDYCLLIKDDFSPAYFNLGNAYLSSDKYQLAIEHFEKCMELDGEDGLALCYIGECYEQLENYDLAKHYYLRSIEFIPELPEAWLGLGIVFDLEGNTTEGIRLILKAIDFNPENGSFYHVLANAYEKIDLVEEANTAYLLALEYETDNEEALTDYIEFFIDQGAIKEALYFVDSHELAKDLDFTKELIRVNLFWLLGKHEEAISKLILLIAANYKKAKELLTLYPKLENENKIVTLFLNN